MSRTLTFLLFIALLVAIDLYAYKGISTALAGLSAGLRRWVKIIYWTVSVAMVLMLCFGALRMQEIRSSHNHAFLFTFIGLFVLFLLPKVVIVVFHGLEDLVQFFRWGWSKLAPGAEPASGETMGRIRFLSQVGLALAAIPFGSVLYGLTKGRSNFNVARVRVDAKGLPKEFDGLRIVQISDMHLGSYHVGSDIVQHGIDLINAQEPDLILFTGDLVNDFAEEAEPWLGQLKGLKARLGKYSILGNHDYSDYAQWPSVEEKAKNLERLKGHHATMGFRLMLDENLRIEKEGAHFALIGVQNWGTRFQQYGDLAKARRGSESAPYRILMSHDPSHWDAQVRSTGIELTLSGHTHGAQFGVTLAGHTYSPAQWAYKQWAGLYTEGVQHLYVNRGFGYIGFPGRVGMPPEITVLELHSA